MKRAEIRALGIEDEGVVTKVLNALNGAIEDAKEALQPKPKPEPTPTATEPTPPKGSAPDGDVDALRRELAAEKAKNEERTLRDAILGGLSEFKPKDSETLYKLIDPTKVVIKDGKVESGLKEQIEPMKQSQGYLFSDTADDKGGTEVKGGAAGITMNDILRGG